MKNKIIESLVISLIICSLPMAAAAVTIEDIGPQVGMTMMDIRPFLINIVSLILGFIGVVSVSMIIYGGSLLLVAGGNEDVIQHGRRIVIGAVIGIVLVLSSWVLASNIFGVVSQVTS
jgi:hypothetical protein